jgi:hypothetical protein
MKKNVFLMALLAIGILFSSCMKEEMKVEVVQEDEVCTIKIEGVVMDSETGNPIEGVSVRLLGKDSVLTDAKGYYNLGVHNTGLYYISAKKEGYSSYSQEILMPNESYSFAQEQTITIPISIIKYNLSGSLSGTVYKRTNHNYLYKPFANAPYTISHSFIKTIEGTTDASGNYSASNLPNDSYVDVEFDFEKDGLSYYYNTNIHIDGETKEDFTLNSSTGESKPLFMVSCNILNTDGTQISNFDPINGTIIIKFNQPINVDSYSIYLNGSSYYNIENISWSSNNTVLTITPQYLNYDQSYSLDLELYPEYGIYYLYTDIYFRTKAE